MVCWVAWDRRYPLSQVATVNRAVLTLPCLSSFLIDRVYSVILLFVLLPDLVPENLRCESFGFAVVAVKYCAHDVTVRVVTPVK